MPEPSCEPTPYRRLFLRLSVPRRGRLRRRSCYAARPRRGALPSWLPPVALIWANSPWSGAYESLRHFDLASLHLDRQHWVDDALLMIFFFVVGLELKYELVLGVLRDPRTPRCPSWRDLGDAVPALIYLARPADGHPDGWGMPMATDIAFAVAVVAVVGANLPDRAARLPADPGHRRRLIGS